MAAEKARNVSTHPLPSLHHITHRPPSVRRHRYCGGALPLISREGCRRGSAPVAPRAPCMGPGGTGTSVEPATQPPTFTHQPSGSGSGSGSIILADQRLSLCHRRRMTSRRTRRMMTSRAPRRTPRCRGIPAPKQSARPQEPWRRAGGLRHTAGHNNAMAHLERSGGAAMNRWHGSSSYLDDQDEYTLPGTSAHKRPAASDNEAFPRLRRRVRRSPAHIHGGGDDRVLNRRTYRPATGGH